MISTVEQNLPKNPTTWKSREDKTSIKTYKSYPTPRKGMVLRMVFNPILFLLHSTGISVIHKNGECNFITMVPILLCWVIVLLNFLYDTRISLVNADFKAGLAYWIAGVIDVWLKVAVFRKRKDLLAILKLLSKLHLETMTPSDTKRFKKYSLWVSVAVCLLGSALSAFEIYSAFLTEVAQVDEMEITPPDTLFPLLYFFRWSRSAYIIIHNGFINAFVLYYCFTCYVLKKFFDASLERFKEKPNHLQVKIYESILDAVSDVDDIFCFPVFLNISVSVLRLFLLGYNFSSEEIETLLLNCFLAAYIMMCSFGQMAVASTVGEAGNNLRLEFAKSEHLNLDLKLVQTINLPVNHLTVWKISDITRALTISTIGDFLTYSVLFATLLNTIK